MKDKWLKVSDILPTLEYISDNWSSSRLCFCTDGEDAFTAFYQQIDGKLFWDGYRRYDNVTYWQPIEFPAI